MKWTIRITEGSGKAFKVTMLNRAGYVMHEPFETNSLFDALGYLSGVIEGSIGSPNVIKEAAEQVDEVKDQGVQK